ncbi:uncharacterized protein PG998_014250 [Apiospora kogelbergensis]|uniref:uncharacterized protein n=1 Tax=Apiospora kogelbergensis TaxID=1337665 RepID=UPI003130DEE4
MAPDSAASSLSSGVCGTAAGSRGCGRCRGVAYCGKAHQRQDWPAHKAVCRPPAGRAGPGPATAGGAYDAAASRGGEADGEARTAGSDQNGKAGTGTTTTLTYSTVVNTAAPGVAPRYEEFSRDEVLRYLLRS